MNLIIILAKMINLGLWQGVLNGFFTGLGVGLANWIFIKRLEYLEKKILKKLNLKQK